MGFSTAFALLILGSGLVIYLLLAARLRADRVLVLEDRLEAVSALLKSPAHGLEELGNRIRHEWPLRGGEKVFVRVLDGTGKTIVETPRLPPSLAEVLARPMRTAKCDGQDNVSVAADGREDNYLACAAEMENSLGLAPPVSVRAVIGEQQSLDFLSTLRSVLAGVLLFNIAASLLVGFSIVRREIAPLRSIAEKVARIDSQTLRERIEAEHLPQELRSLARTFNHTFDRLADSFDRLSQFSSDIAHELRTPVTNIMGSIEVGLTRSRSVEEYRELLESTLEEMSRIRTITDTLLFLARAENLQQELRITPLDLRAEIETVIEFYEAVATEKGIALRLQNGPSGLVLSAEPTLFQRALSNLVSNALRHTERGGKVDVSFGEHGDGIWLSVQDTGQGIPNEDLARIFQRFYRVDPSRNFASGGTGLGLAIVKSIVELHGGHVSVESEVGKGSRFTLRWPAGRERRMSLANNPIE